MQRFTDKGLTERRIYTVAFNNVMEDGATITSAEVTATVYDQSEVTDSSPEDIVDGPADTNGQAVTIDGETIPVDQAVTQAIEAGVDGCDYVLKFTANCSNGEVFTEEVLLRIKKYVPTT